MAPRRPGHPLPHRPRPARTRRSSDASACDDAEARRAFEEELALDPTNANAAYELAEMHRKAGELEPGAQALRAGAGALSGVRARAGRTGANADRARPCRPTRFRTLQAALTPNPESEVACYQLAQAYRALGNTAEQEKALAEFNRSAASRHGAAPRSREPKQDVTPQVLDVKPPK